MCRVLFVEWNKFGQIPCNINLKLNLLCILVSLYTYIWNWPEKLVRCIIFFTKTAGCQINKKNYVIFMIAFIITIVRVLAQQILSVSRTMHWCLYPAHIHTHTHAHKEIGALNQYDIWQFSKLDFGTWLQGYIEFIQLHSIYIYLGILSLSIPFCLLPPYPFFLIFPEHPGFSYILMAAVWSEWSKKTFKCVSSCWINT